MAVLYLFCESVDIVCDTFLRRLVEFKRFDVFDPECFEFVKVLKDLEVLVRLQRNPFVFCMKYIELEVKKRLKNAVLSTS